MSISLPNGTFIPAPSSSHAQVSAAVTRILHLSNFSADLKTRDLQLMFKEWEAEKGGFRIKWLDDVNALVVFADATVAKRAYLSLLLHPPSRFLPPAQIKPYDRPDAAQIIQSLAARAMGHRSSMSSALTSGHFANLPASSNDAIPGLPSHHRTGSSSISGLSGFSMPNSKSSISMPPPKSTSSRMGNHQRTGSASSSWTRNSTSGMGALNFSFPTQRLPTHSESSAGPSRSTSSSGTDDTPIVVMEHAPLSRAGGALHPGGIPASELKARRDSMSADKALKEVQRALASVEAQ
ncbi:hypothetical protein BCR39DRAFT_524641 [Naematelia encephala]|uniref:Uncharacterized protein n=1 Tax=Naematelia encephala TaxID=71784 RepID=A0A1Y2BAQ1_9TREE|nr:hypothetical protein BCR39DRAFT_524641 [Naematelia encephala]